MADYKWLPDNFTVIKERDITIFAKKRHKEELLNLGKTLFDFSGNNKDVHRTFTGRGRCLAMPCDDMAERIIIRRYYHGGLLGAMVGDLFWNQARPINELMISEMALEMGLKSAEVVAVIKHNILYPFFKAEIATREITGASDLIHCIKDNISININLLKKKRSIIHEIASAVRKMHDIGIYHGDLHLKNILLKENHDGSFCAYIIDMDKSKLRQGLDIAKRMKNLRRLDRSVEKLAALFRRRPDTYNRSFPVNRTDRVRFFKEYMRDYSENKEEWKRLIRTGHFNYRLHKLIWHIINKGIR